ncbi:hypothetical protein [Bradyrhizobium sp. STM 3562]|uniref:hypothetical protein n=1 Tax=Bradyrhizobium sp. STM 3562 TaxID=578924 RepID=UPI00388F9B6A
MVKSVLAITILALSTSAALAAYRTHHHYRPAMSYHRAMGAYGAVGAPGMGAPPPATMGGVSNSDYTMYMRNLHDSGYNPKNNFNDNGTIKTQ